MLFPLLTKNLDQKQTSKDIILENNSSDKESECLGLEEESYKGPMTCSRTKGITTKTVDIVTKANQKIEQILRTFWINYRISRIRF